MGINAPVLETGVEFIYKIKLGSLYEYEYDHVLYSVLTAILYQTPKKPATGNGYVLTICATI